MVTSHSPENQITYLGVFSSYAILQADTDLCICKKTLLRRGRNRTLRLETEPK